MSPKHKNELTARRGLGRRLAGTLYFAVILLGLLYGALHLVVRTDGFRSLAEEELQRRLGTPFEISRTSLRWNLGLKLEGVRWVGEGPGRAGMSADQVVVEWGLGNVPRPRLRRVVLDGCRLSMARAADGSWEPKLPVLLVRRVARWAEFPLPDNGLFGEAPESVDEPRFELEMRSGDIRWWDQRGVERAWASGIDFHFTPVSLPRRELAHYGYTIRRARDQQGLEVSDIGGEVLHVADQVIFLEVQEGGEVVNSGDRGE